MEAMANASLVMYNEWKKQPHGQATSLRVSRNLMCTHSSTYMSSCTRSMSAQLKSPASSFSRKALLNLTACSYAIVKPSSPP